MDRRARVNALMLAMVRGDTAMIDRTKARVERELRDRSPLRSGIATDVIRRGLVDGRKRPLTVEHRAKLRAAAARRPARAQSAETRAKIAATQRARLGVPMAACHPERRHYGHGQCRQCFNRDYMRAKRARS